MLMKKLKAVFIATIMIVAGNGQAGATEAASKLTNFSIYVIPPSCNVTAPGSVDLGGIGPDAQKEGPAFNIHIWCQYPVDTGFTAVANGGTTLASNTSVHFARVGAPSGAVLSLLDVNDSDAEVDLTGMVSAPGFLGKSFCRGNSTRDCQLKPRITRGGIDPITGTVNAALNFDFIYIY
ncbi:type 1 fimbrial protein [Salmonella enterica subsp. enterica serovar Bredeney]